MSHGAQVAVVKGPDIRRRILDALKLVGGIDKVVGKGDKVFLKPNLVDGAPLETGEVVQLEVLEVIVKEAFRAGASEVVIGDVPTYRGQTETTEKYGHLARSLGAKFLDLSRYPFVEVKVENPVFFSKVSLSKPFLDSDIFINVPTLKTHCQYGITMAIKNMYGLIPKEHRRLYHTLFRVEEAILDLYQARKADLIVVDGTYTTLHVGPRPLEDFKETFRLDLALAGFDPIAVDTVGAKILGIDSRTVRYLRWGEKKGLGDGDLARIRILGTTIEEAYFGKAADSVTFANARMKNVKILNYGACTGCLGLIYYGGLFRFEQEYREMLRDKVLFVMGPDADFTRVMEDVEGEEKIVLCGYCAAPTFYNKLQGDFIPGCPPDPMIAQQKLTGLLVDSRRS